ncbi:MAG: (2Fe-2S)-binding protein [Planctomycetota bacterium]|jgi:NAD(P)H-nitrite reductase large subunit
MDADDTICYCFHVSKRKIQKFIRLEKPRRASQISECGGAGTGCGWCIPFLQKYFEQAADADPMTAEEYAAARGDYIRSGKGKPPSGAIPPPENGSDSSA